jgi:hypothetical protein
MQLQCIQSKNIHDLIVNFNCSTTDCSFSNQCRPTSCEVGRRVRSSDYSRYDAITFIIWQYVRLTNEWRNFKKWIISNRPIVRPANNRPKHYLCISTWNQIVLKPNATKTIGLQYYLIPWSGFRFGAKSKPAVVQTITNISKHLILSSDFHSFPVPSFIHLSTWFAASSQYM